MPAVGATVDVSIPIVVDFPAPFGPEQAEHFAGRDLHVESLHGLDASGVDLPESLYHDRRCIRCAVHDDLLILVR